MDQTFVKVLIGGGIFFSFIKGLQAETSDPDAIYEDMNLTKRFIIFSKEFSYYSLMTTATVLGTHFFLKILEQNL